MKTIALFTLVLAMCGCGASYQPQAMLAAKATLAASHDMIEAICVEGYDRAETAEDIAKADEECQVMRMSYAAAAIGVETWEATSDKAAEPCSK